MKQIEHDPNESRRFKPSIVSVTVTASVMAIGMIATRGGFDGMSWSNSALVTVCGVVGGIAYFSAIHMALKGWDRLWSGTRRKTKGPA